MIEKTSLEPTAALVIDLASKYYSEDALTHEFLKYLDTSSGQVLIDATKDAGIYELSQEINGHRKFIIRHSVLEAVNNNPEESQVVILAAGKAPLAIELLSRQYEKLRQVYEVDVSPLDQKHGIYQKIAPQLCNKVQFIQEDIRSETLLKNLEQSGFNPALHTIIVLEGITHYMSPEELVETLSRFASPTPNKNTCVIDFGPPYESITPRIQPLARQAYKIIEEKCYLQPMTKHTAEGMTKMFAAFGGDVLHHYTIHDIEKLRTGENKIFPEKNSGWLEYIVARI